MKYSLIIPAYNAEKTIGLCLESALNQSVSQDAYEIVVVDDGSSDRTPAIVKNYPVRLVQQPNQGPASARNRGAKEASGELLIFTDSDCELSVDFIKKIVAPIEQHHEIVGVQGSYKTKQPEFIAQYCQIEVETRYKRMAKNTYIDFIATYAAAYRKDIFWKYGGFDTNFPAAVGEDADFSYTLHENGYKMVFAPEAFVYHHHPATLNRYLTMKFYRGFWRMRLHKKHPQKLINDSYTPKSLKFEGLSILFLLLFSILSLFNKFWLIPFFLIIISFLFFSIPFYNLFKKKHYSQGYFIPVMLFLRAFSVLLGMVFGIINEIHQVMTDKTTLQENSLNYPR